MASVFIWIPNDIWLFYQQYKMAGNRVSNEQLEELLEFLAARPCLAKGVGLGVRSKQQVDKQWNDLALRLNSFGNGSSKTGDRWKRYWADLKFKTKSRLTRRRQDALGTGGGPSSQEDLSEIDKKVLAIIGERAVYLYGDSEHRVPVFNIQSEATRGPVQPEDIVVSEEVVISDTEFPEPVAGPSQVELIQVLEPEPNLTDETVRQPARYLTHRQHRASLPRSQTRIDPEWVMELERSRVQAEHKLADAALMIAAATKVIGQASLISAETSRKQLEVISTLVEVLREKAARSD